MNIILCQTAKNRCKIKYKNATNLFPNLIYLNILMEEFKISLNITLFSYNSSEINAILVFSWWISRFMLKSLMIIWKELLIWSFHTLIQNLIFESLIKETRINLSGCNTLLKIESLKRKVIENNVWAQSLLQAD